MYTNYPDLNYFLNKMNMIDNMCVIFVKKCIQKEMYFQQKSKIFTNKIQLCPSVQNIFSDAITKIIFFVILNTLKMLNILLFYVPKY